MKTVDADYVSLLNKYKDEIIKRCPGVIKSYLLDIIKEDADNYVEMHKKLLNLRINPKTKLKCIETNERSIFKLIWVYMGPMLHSSIWCPTEIKWYKESLKRKGLTEDSWWKQERMDYLNFLKSFKGNFKKFVGTFNVGNTEYSTMYKDPESLLQYFAFLSLDALRRNSNAINDIDNKFVSLIKQDTNFKRYFDYKLFMLRTLSMAGLFDVRAIFARDEDITFKNGQIFIKTIKPNFKNK